MILYMASWGTKRKIMYAGVFIILLGGIFTGLFFGVFYKKPTCFDGKQNAKESGIDCGGACRKVCEAEAIAPVVSWARAFETSAGVYNVAAYIENPNINSTAREIPYIFRLFDESNILVYERKGKTDIQQGSTFVVFETNINTGNRRAKYTFFEFTETPDWQITSTSLVSDNLRVKSQNLDQNSKPIKFQAVIENLSLKTINDIEVTVILYNDLGNAIATSKTILDEIGREGEAIASFTWDKLEENATRFEVVTKVR